MTDSLRRRGKRSMAFPPKLLEEQAELGRLAPFEVPQACVCGSRNRTYNTDRRAFCRRCGREQKAQ